MLYSAMKKCWMRVGSDITYYKNNYYFKTAPSTVAPPKAKVTTTTITTTSSSCVTEGDDSDIEPVVDTVDSKAEVVINGDAPDGRDDETEIVISSTSAGASKRFYTATFTLEFPHSNDVCFMAYHYPYTYSMLQVSYHNICLSPNWPANSANAVILLQKDLGDMERVVGSEVGLSHVYYRCQTLCHTLSGHHCPILTITNKRRVTDLKESKKAVSEGAQLETEGNELEEGGSREVLGNNIRWNDKKYVVLSSRVHPGESNSSWVMRGMYVP